MVPWYNHNCRELFLQFTFTCRSDADNVHTHPPPSLLHPPSLHHHTIPSSNVLPSLYPLLPHPHITLRLLPFAYHTSPLSLSPPHTLPCHTLPGHTPPSSHPPLPHPSLLTPSPATPLPSSHPPMPHSSPPLLLPHPSPVWSCLETV